MMQAARFAGDRKIEIRQIPLPVPTAGEVLLRVRACSLCGSDLRVFRNGWPVTPGHEILGVVDKPGDRLHGQRCLVYIPVWCGRCDQCQAQRPHLCENATDLMGWQRDGGYAEALAVPRQCLLPVPDDIPDHLATLLLDTIGTAAHGMRLSARLAPSGRVLILGAGPIGLGAMLVALQMGYGPVEVFDPNPMRRGVAAELGGVALESLEGRPAYPLILECSGNETARQNALERVAAMGAVIQLGEAAGWQVNETKAIRRKDFFYVRSFYFPISEYAANIELLRAHRAQYERLVDERAPLAGLNALFEEFANGRRIKPQLSLAA